MYLRPIIYDKAIFQISEFYVKGFKSYPHFTYHYVPVPGECFSSLVQAVMSQAENYKHLKEVLID